MNMQARPHFQLPNTCSLVKLTFETLKTGVEMWLMSPLLSWSLIVLLITLKATYIK